LLENPSLGLVEQEDVVGAVPMVGGLNASCPKFSSWASVAVAPPPLSKDSPAQITPLAGMGNWLAAGIANEKNPPAPAGTVMGLNANAASSVPGPPLVPSLAKKLISGSTDASAELKFAMLARKKLIGDPGAAAGSRCRSSASRWSV
jgi:hypothetical protein